MKKRKLSVESNNLLDNEINNLSNISKSDSDISLNALLEKKEIVL